MFMNVIHVMQRGVRISRVCKIHDVVRECQGDAPKPVAAAAEGAGPSFTSTNTAPPSPRATRTSCTDQWQER